MNRSSGGAQSHGRRNGLAVLSPTAAERAGTKGGCFGHAQPCALDRPTLILPGLQPATEA